MNILDIIKDNLPEGTEISEKVLKAIEKEIKAEQGKEFVPKEQYAKKTDKIIELEAENGKLQGKSADADTYKQKHDTLQAKYDTDIAAKQKEYDDFKVTTEAKEATAAKQSVLRKQLEADGANPKLTALLEKEFDLEKIEIVDGKIKGWDELSKSVKETYADVFGEASTGGIKPVNPPAGGQVTYTLEDIKKMSPEEINKNWESIKNMNMRKDK